MESKKLSRRELFEKIARLFAIGSMGAVAVKLNLNKSDKRVSEYPCPGKSCPECGLYKNCNLIKEKVLKES